MAPIPGTTSAPAVGFARAIASSSCSERNAAMALTPFAAAALESETRALLTRLARVQPFALQETMLPAASLQPAAQIAIESFLTTGRRHLRTLAEKYLLWLRSPHAMAT